MQHLRSGPSVHDLRHGLVDGQYYILGNQLLVTDQGFYADNLGQAVAAHADEGLGVHELLGEFHVVVDAVNFHV
jgi:hypothetical protein